MDLKNVIEVKNLCKTFGKRKIVDNINLSIEEGDIYGFLGQNGSGKTTTIRMLLGLIHPDSGSIKLNQHCIKTEFNKAIEKVGAIVEIPKFYPYLSGRKNLELMANLIPDIEENRVEEILEIVGLTDRADDKISTYSLGMRQRLGIANALLNDPSLVILDEPTNGLDPKGMKEIRDLISNLASNRNITFFISTHLLNEVEQICNKVSILHEGKVLAEGRVKDLLDNEFEKVELYTSMIEPAIDIIRLQNYVKDFTVFQRGIIINLEKGCCTKLNKLLVSREIEVEYLIPHRQTLEEYFLDLTNGGNKHA